MVVTACGGARLRAGVARPRRVAGAVPARVAHTRSVRAALLTIGNELVSGDVTNSNAPGSHAGSRRAGFASCSRRRPRRARRDRRLRQPRTRPRRSPARHRWARRHPRRPHPGGARAAFAVPQEEVAELAAALRRRFPPPRLRGGAGRCCRGEAGALVNPRGGAPGLHDRERLGARPGSRPRWRRCSTPTPTSSARASRSASGGGSSTTGEGEIVDLLRRAVAGWPTVELGSYPRFGPEGAERRDRAQVERPSRARRPGRLARA